jgi:hypothetical protein
MVKADLITQPKPLATRYWRELSTAAFDAMPPETVAVLPIGAIEQHGPHLPVWVDSCINEVLLDRALEAIPKAMPVLAMPLQAVGKSNEHIAFAGTLSLSCETLVATLVELGEGVHRTRIRRLILLNSHGGQPQVMDIVARELRIRHAMLVVNAAWFDMGMPAELFSASECPLVRVNRLCFLIDMERKARSSRCIAVILTETWSKSHRIQHCDQGAISDTVGK